MFLEERLERLEKENIELKQRLAALEGKGGDVFVTAEELAKNFKCSTNTIYVKIREGEIAATRKAGGVRIPMSQFYQSCQLPNVVHIPKKRKKEPQTLKERVFG